MIHTPKTPSELISALQEGKFLYLLASTEMAFMVMSVRNPDSHGIDLMGASTQSQNVLDQPGVLDATLLSILKTPDVWAIVVEM